MRASSVERVQSQIAEASEIAGMGPQPRRYMVERKAILDLLAKAALILNGTLSTASCRELNLPDVCATKAGSELASYLRAAKEME